MPMVTPGSLSNDEVYAVTAYVLSQARIVASDAVLGKDSLAQVQMPNRDGFVADPRPEDLPPVAQSPHSK